MTFFFETFVIGSRPNGVVSIALIDRGHNREHVIIAACSRETALSLSSALKHELNRSEDDDETI